MSIEYPTPIEIKIKRPALREIDFERSLKENDDDREEHES